ncbi:hypothetical protein [Thalassomonas sp. M1454]|uniref:hypothetical protein n=1 Tax=Thalassomonas sp. M1454 TaxID=2594477 RepID=UPI00118032AD|nr:hypothetical protein [Thalassomonas sp. M1454]TRX57178.1 hypothetical protein FNN08_06680 [Thalassomonas sp. M1454]
MKILNDFDLRVLETAKTWYLEGTVYDPDDKKWPKHPSFVYRVRGEWTSWVDELDPEHIELESDEYFKYVYQDLIEEKAWKIYNVLICIDENA